MKYLPLNPAIFINNRKRFVKPMAPNSIAIFVINDEFQYNGDAITRFQSKIDIKWRRARR